MAITLDNGKSRVTVRPDLGAGATGYDFHDGAAWQQVFRRVDDDTSHPFQLSNILLVPFSGRVSGGGFIFEGQFHAIERNLPTEKYPIHGSAFALPWAIADQSSESISLTLSANAPGPFRYDARMTYALNEASLVMRLEIVNRGIRLPFGIGFHPWFVRDSDTRLMASADRVWLEREDHLPAKVESVARHPDMNFNVSRKLPARWINNWFSGWNREARIDWPARGISAVISATEELGQYVLYSPSEDAGFFCFEPVSHPVDAFNLPEGPVAHGMTVLDTSGRLVAEMRITPEVSPRNS